MNLDKTNTGLVRSGVGFGWALIPLGTLIKLTRDY
jgi:hypothetical protein